MEPLLLWTDDRMLLHDPGAGHPERPERLAAVREELHALDSGGWRQAEAASRAEIERVHSSRHVDRVFALRGQFGSLDPDTGVCPDSVDAALLAAGAAVGAVQGVFGGEARRAVALVRPPGHHAESDRAMGFCLFNNLAIAAAHACAELGCERVLVVDWDVHHGNGTEQIFYERSDVLYYSMHQYPFYPGTGAATDTGRGAGTGKTVNVPLPPGRDAGDYLAAIRELLVPVADAYQPDLVLVSAGYDGHRADPLGGMRLSDGDFAAMTAEVCSIADRHAAGRLVLVLEGGYDLGALARSVRRSLEVMAQASPEAGGDLEPQAEPTDVGRAVIDLVREQQNAFWPV